MAKSNDIFAKFPRRRVWDVGPQTSCTNTFSCSYIKTTPLRVVRLKGVICACVHVCACVYALLSLSLFLPLKHRAKSTLKVDFLLDQTPMRCNLDINSHNSPSILRNQGMSMPFIRCSMLSHHSPSPQAPTDLVSSERICLFQKVMDTDTQST